MHDHDKKQSNTCMACSCPCSVHTKHTHGEHDGKDHDEDKSGGTCMACSCPCDEHKKHTCGC